MNNNDILRKIRYTFDYDDAKMIEIFGLAEVTVKRSDISDWLKRDDDPQNKVVPDQETAVFLNGFIILKRGPKDGAKDIPEKIINNNIVLRKLKIALNTKDTDMIEILDLAGLRISKPELSAFFRKPDHKHYRKCQDQFLRNFLYGMDLKYNKKRK